MALDDMDLLLEMCKKPGIKTIKVPVYGRRYDHKLDEFIYKVDVEGKREWHSASVLHDWGYRLVDEQYMVQVKEDKTI